METPLHQFPVPPPAPPPPVPLPAQVDALLQQQAVAARALMMAAAAGTGNNIAPAAAAGPGREQCPRCASRDTKFCYYNNYNTAQPRHLCRACRRYWTLGGSLRNVPVGGSTRTKRHRHARRPSRRGRGVAVAAAAMPAAGSPFAAASPATTTLQSGGLLVSSLGGSSVPASSALSPLIALGSAPPLLEGRLGYDLVVGLGEAALALASGGATGDDLAHQHQQLPLGAGGPLWPAAAETTAWKAASSSSFVSPFESFPPALWQHQELAAAAPVVETAGGLHHGGDPHPLLL